MKKILAVGGICAITAFGAQAHESNLTGWYVGANAGLLTQPIGTENTFTEVVLINPAKITGYGITLKQTTGVFGAFGGYNCQINQYKLGIEAGLNFNVGKSSNQISKQLFTVDDQPPGGLPATTLSFPSEAFNLSFKREYDTSLLFKPGLYFASGNAALYGILGMNYASFKYEATFDPSNAGAARETQSKKFNAVGFSAGLGLEYGFTCHLLAHFDYTYTQYKGLETKTLSFGAGPDQTIDSKITPKYHKFSIGITYKF